MAHLHVNGGIGRSMAQVYGSSQCERRYTCICRSMAHVYVNVNGGVHVGLWHRFMAYLNVNGGINVGLWHRFEGV